MENNCEIKELYTDTENNWEIEESVRKHHYWRGFLVASALWLVLFMVLANIIISKLS